MAMNCGTESTNQALGKTAMRGTAILITVSLTFIVLTGPDSIYYTIFEHSIDQVIYVALRLPKTLNHGINGLMYCIVGSKFRQELLGLICCKKSSRKTVIGERTTQVTLTSNVNE